MRATHGSTRISCAEYSRAAGEEIAGTVKPVDLWLLIEYRARWTREAIAVFSETVQERLGALRARNPKMRLALIRQPDRTAGPLTSFWAISREHEPELYRTEFADYEELSFDMDRSDNVHDEKLFAVCAHGTHDLCCAEFGNKIYSGLRANSTNVWQISHIGGCRFAPNVVCLPHGIVYGRVEQADCAAIVSEYERDSVVPAKLRGRSCYPKPVQAAEQLIRSASQLTALQDLSLTSATELQLGHWSTTFQSRDSKQHRVSVVYEDTHFETYKSCSATEPEPRGRFRLVD